MVESLDESRGREELLSFVEETPVVRERPAETAPAIDRGSWKLLIVDDEDEVHTLTRLVLRGYEFEGRGLQLLSAWSAAGARQIIRDNPDLAIILLDVVMEHEDSGLRLVQYIRNELGNKHVRIILRTGQPGQAPEQEVVAQYDINDYKAKTELTSPKLFTTVTSGLRSWRDIMTIDRNRQGLQKVIDASSVLFKGHSLGDFAAATLERLVQLAGRGDGRLQTECTGPAARPVLSGLVARRLDTGYVCLQGCGAYAEGEGQLLQRILPDYILEKIDRVMGSEVEFFFNHSFVSCIRTEEGREILFLLTGGPEFGHVDRDLIRIFMANVAIAYHNMNLSQEIIATQKEIIHTLGEVVETRSKETANHVMRVGKMARILGTLAGLDEEEVAVLAMAAPMHDVGKVGIPDAILNKPGKLTPGEYEVMQTHTTIGHEIMGKSERRIMRSAALVALQHHERWDGSGYPFGISGKRIHIFGRITALVDVFDALTSSRVYRDARDVADVVALIEDERGRQFDPELVDCFTGNLGAFIEVVRAHPDQTASAGKADRGQA